MKSWKKRGRKRKKSKVVAIQDEGIAVTLEISTPEFLPDRPLLPARRDRFQMMTMRANFYALREYYDYYDVVPFSDGYCHLHNTSVLCGAQDVELSLPVEALAHDRDGHCVSCHHPRCPRCRTLADTAMFEPYSHRA